MSFIFQKTHKYMNIRAILLGCAIALPTLQAEPASPSASKQEPSSEQGIGTITTSFGRSYQECRVCQIDPDGVIFAHKKGIAKILFGEIPESLRAKLGYDAQKSADYAKEQAEKKRRAEELRAELQKEMIKAEAAVSVAEIQNSAFMQQSFGMGGAFPGFAGLTGGLYGWDNSLWNGSSWGNNGRGWKDGCYGTPGGTTILSNPRCGVPLLNVISNNRGGFGPVNCQRPANNFFAVPPLRMATPALSFGGHAASGHR